jgi:hypothetical protein
MIAFLTFLYGGILYLLVRFKVVPWNTFWKVSPAIWMVVCESACKKDPFSG